MAYFIVVLLDDKRFAKIRSTGLEEKVEYMFGGELRCLNVYVSEEMKERLLKEFDSARIDSRGAITDLPVAFLRELFNQVVEKKDLGVTALEGVFSKIDEIKKMAAKESEFLPAPEVNE